MLELVGIITLANAIKRIVREKGLKPFRFVAIMVVLWIGFEIIGIYIGFILFGDVLAAYLMAFPGAAVGAILSYRIARNAEPIKSKYSIENFGKEVE